MVGAFAVLFFVLYHLYVSRRIRLLERIFNYIYSF